ncbi:hypothetical protein B0J11DRAFT_243866 [Dendryphion nanum]|uniref:Rhodopsin domain-containing protein n=1 Tax=Dendryphion nanum TaxID=256645 RepID=A0A9P9E516_9PLEO|nr:hypothetical protein B0J11DRAFT_243866 [Dendryphion nanum]
MTTTVPIENSGQVGLLVSSSISIFIVVVAVILRLIAKHIASKLDYSDYCIVGALIWNTALHSCCMILVTHGGFGFHTMEIYQRFGPDTATFFFKGIMSFALLWNATVCFSKVSVLLMYTSLIPVPSMIKWAKWIGALIIAWNTGNVIAGFLICRPLARNWDFTIPGTCGSQPNFYFAMGMVNLVTDLMLIILPMPYLYKLRMALRKKIIAGAMLSIGIGTWVITIYRQTLLPGLDFTDMTYTGVLATLLSGLEPAVAIVLACIPLMRPLLGRRGSNSNTNTGYDYSGSGNSGLYSGKKRNPNSRDLNTFTELGDDADDGSLSSVVQLQPIKPGGHEVRVEVYPEGRGRASSERVGQGMGGAGANGSGIAGAASSGNGREAGISVERKFEVRSE